MRKHKWTDRAGRKCVVDSVKGVATVRVPVGLRDYGIEQRDRIMLTIWGDEILRLAGENAALMAEAERLKGALKECRNLTRLQHTSLGTVREVGHRVGRIVGEALNETAPITKDGE